MTTTEPLSDPRDMFMIHTVFRREFGLMPALVRSVPAGDVDRAAVIADHVSLVDNLLHHHHSTEDKYIWPKLLDRVATELEPVVHVMENQHEDIHKLNAEVVAALDVWRGTADPAHGEMVAGTIDRLIPLLFEHLGLEEERVVPLIAQHITAAEWNEMVSDGALDIDPEVMPVIFGMAMYEGDPEIIADTIKQMPPEVQPVIADIGAKAYAAHSERVHGTPTPPKVD